MGLARTRCSKINCSLNLLCLLLLQHCLGHDSDNHILDFVYDKLGLNHDETNFETRLYLCLSAFQAIGLGDLARQADKSYAIYLYAFTALTSASAVALTALAKWFGFQGHKAVTKASGSPRGSLDARVESWLRWIDCSSSIGFIVRMDQRPALCFHIAQSIIFGKNFGLVQN